MRDRKSLAASIALAAFVLTPFCAHAGKSPVTATSRENYTPDEAIEKFTTDLTVPDVRPFLGRVDDIRALMERLHSRDLKGTLVKAPPGTGKTALVRELARQLKALYPEAEVRDLSLGQFKSGANIEGDAEARTMPILEWAAAKPHRYLVVDEAHMLAQIPTFTENAKAKLGRGEVAIVAMTTDREFATSGLKDNEAFMDRFKPLDLAPYDHDEIIEIMLANREDLQDHFGVDIQYQAIEAIVQQLERLTPGDVSLRRAIDIMNGTMARAMLDQKHGAIAESVLKDTIARRENKRAELEKDFVKYVARGESHADLRLDTQIKLAALDAEIEQLKKGRGKDEVTADLIETSGRLAKAQALYLRAVAERDATTIIAALDDLEGLKSELAKIQETKPAVRMPAAPVHPEIDRQAVADYMLASTGVSADWVGKSVVERMESIAKILDRVQGQKTAKAELLKGIEDHFTMISPPDGPGFMLLLDGATGSGKSELVRALALGLTGNAHGQVKIDMNTMHEHSAMRLMGSGPGLVGSEKGSAFDEFLRKPGAILHLEELDKASPEALKMFYQIMSEGIFKDANGNVIDFRNRFIVASSNFTGAYSLIRDLSNREIESRLEFPKYSLGAFDGVERDDKVLELTLLQRGWKPEMIGRFAKRLVVEPMNHEMAIGVAKNKLGDYARHWKKRFGWNVTFEDKIAEEIATRFFKPLEGGRSVVAGAKEVAAEFGRARLREIEKLQPEFFDRLAEVGLENRDQLPKIFPMADDHVEIRLDNVTLTKDPGGEKLDRPIDATLMRMHIGDHPVLGATVLGEALGERLDIAPLAEAVGEAGRPATPNLALGAKGHLRRKGRAAFPRLEGPKGTPHK